MAAYTRDFGLRVGCEIKISIAPADISIANDEACVAAYFGGRAKPDHLLVVLLQRGVPIVPVATTLAKVSEEIPQAIQFLNCIGYDNGGPEKVALTMLECIGLLPRQRRVFVSYRRDEASAAAVQLFDALSALQFDVFLDTHGVAAAEDFQAILWHRLCDSDVLIMLDSATYFDSRWTVAEFGRALAKNIPVLRVGFPGVAPSKRVITPFRLDLSAAEYDSKSGRLAPESIVRIATMLEAARSRSHAVRSLMMLSSVRLALETIGGHVDGVGPRNVIHLTLPDERRLSVMTVVGVPTSASLQAASEQGAGAGAAVIFDHVGLHGKWLEHLDWLGKNVNSAQWVKLAEASWQFADWRQAP